MPALMSFSWRWRWQLQLQLQPLSMSSLSLTSSSLAVTAAGTTVAVVLIGVGMGCRCSCSSCHPLLALLQLLLLSAAGGSQTGWHLSWCRGVVMARKTPLLVICAMRGLVTGREGLEGWWWMGMGDHLELAGSNT